MINSYHGNSTYGAACHAGSKNTSSGSCGYTTYSNAGHVARRCGTPPACYTPPAATCGTPPPATCGNSNSHGGSSNSGSCGGGGNSGGGGLFGGLLGKLLPQLGQMFGGLLKSVSSIAKILEPLVAIGAAAAPSVASLVAPGSASIVGPVASIFSNVVSATASLSTSPSY